MPALELPPAQRRALRARAHALHPAVIIGEAGLSPAVLAEIGRSLASHELIKIKVAGEGRGRRESLLGEICDRLSAAPVQHIGKILVIYREKPEPEPPAPRKARPAPRRPPATRPKTRARGIS
jgi:putative YhbY family RNA-binding protein